MKPKHSKLIDQLYIEMYDGLVSYAQSSFGDESLAEEAVQEAFQIACLKPDQLYKSPNPKGWLVNTVKNTIRNMNRNRECTRQVISRYLLEQQERVIFLEDKVSLELLYEDISHLEEFKLIKEMAIDGRSILEMANARGITVGACRKRVQRAKETLQKIIKKGVTFWHDENIYK